MNKRELVSYLDEYLENDKIKDNSRNGLQVDNDRKEVARVGYAVDATSYIFDKAIKEDVDFLIVHHGLFWGKEEQILTGLHYSRINKLIKNDIVLYCSHLPLDKHRTVGNNAGILNTIIELYNLSEGDYEIENFGDHDDTYIGYGIRLNNGIDISDIVSKICDKLSLEKNFYNFGSKELIKNIAILSGGGASFACEAKDKKYELLITGDTKYGDMLRAKEIGQSILLGGHYETETVGVKLLAKYLEERFELETIFLDESYKN